jgi:hypothetical protein
MVCLSHAKKISFTNNVMLCDGLTLGIIYTEDRLVISQDQLSSFGMASEHEHT